LHDGLNAVAILTDLWLSSEGLEFAESTKQTNKTVWTLGGSLLGHKLSKLWSRAALVTHRDQRKSCNLIGQT